MSTPTKRSSKRNVQGDLFGGERGLLDRLLTDSRLYRTSSDYKALLDFVVRLRNFAPFNAMLLQVQKPGLTYAASAHDWFVRFGRRPKEGARPLLILWPFGPVALVYDVMDTEGRALPQDVGRFFASGPIGEQEIETFRDRTRRKKIEWDDLDAGDGKAGSIRCIHRALDEDDRNIYRILINRNHTPAVRFATVAHELAHLFLGHLGSDEALGIKKSQRPTHRWCELEAESVSYLVCARNGVFSRSETYLVDFVEHTTTIDDLDVYSVIHAADQIEALLGLGAQTRVTDNRARR